MEEAAGNLVDWAKFARMRTELGAISCASSAISARMARKRSRRIEEAMHRRDAAALVLPAHTMKAEARQFGAEPLGDLAEEIEQAGRRALESRLFPDEILPQVARLRPIYLRTMALFERETNPLVGAAPDLRSRREQPGVRPALDAAEFLAFPQPRFQT